jgi:hypothetical protein
MFPQILQRAMPLLQRLAQSNAGGFAGMGNKINMIGNDMADRMQAIQNLPQAHQGPAAPAPVMGQPQQPPMSFTDRFPGANAFKPAESGAADAQHWPGPAPQPQAAPRPQPQGNPFPTPLNGNPFPLPQGYNAAFPNPNANGPKGPEGYNPNVGNMSAPNGEPKARQVLDPATGQMMNDFYTKSFPSFFRPNIG